MSRTTRLIVALKTCIHIHLHIHTFEITFMHSKLKTYTVEITQQALLYKVHGNITKQSNTFIYLFIYLMIKAKGHTGHLHCSEIYTSLLQCHQQIHKCNITKIKKQQWKTDILQETITMLLLKCIPVYAVELFFL